MRGRKPNTKFPNGYKKKDIVPQETEESKEVPVEVEEKAEAEIIA